MKNSSDMIESLDWIFKFNRELHSNRITLFTISLIKKFIKIPWYSHLSKEMQNGIMLLDMLIKQYSVVFDFEFKFYTMKVITLAMYVYMDAVVWILTAIIILY